MHICLLNLMIMSFSMQAIAQTQSTYRYSRNKSNLLFNAVTCLDSGVLSLSHCAALAGGSKTVTFFYNENDNRCQWDCMFLYTENCTTLCTSPWTSYELEHERNAALHKLPTASSVLQNASSLWGSTYATDGIFQTTGTEIFHSAAEVSPWLMIALQEISTISFLRVYNRDGDRFHDVAVEVSNSSEFVQCGFYKGPGKARQVIEIQCDSRTIAQQVRLKIIHGTENYLNIPELEIYIM